MIKSTYGTGCFALLNTGATPVASKNKLLTTIAYQLNGKRTYALEGSIFVAGSAVQWLRDGLGIIKQASETGPLADDSDSMQSVYLVPALAGVYREPAKFADNWRLEHRFKPAMSAATREWKLAGWARAVKGVLASDEGE